MRIVRQHFCEASDLARFHSMAISPDGKILVGCTNGNVQTPEKSLRLLFWDTKDGLLLESTNIVGDRLKSVSFDARFNQVIACSEDEIHVRKFGTFNAWRKVTKPEGTIDATHYADGTLLYSVDKKLHGLKIETDDPFKTYHPHVYTGFTLERNGDLNPIVFDEEISCMAATEKLNYLAIGTGRRVILSFFRKDRLPQGSYAEILYADEKILALAWLTNHRLLYGTRNGLYYVDVDHGMVQKHVIRNASVTHITIVSENTIAIVAGLSGHRIEYYEIDARGILAPPFVQEFKLPVTSLLAFGNGQYIATNTNCDALTQSTRPSILDYGSPNLGREFVSRIFNKLPV